MYLTSAHTSGEDMYHSHTVVKSLFPGEERVLFSNTFGRVKVLSSNKPTEVRAYDGSEVVDIKEVSSPEAGKTITVKILFNPTKQVRLTKGGNRSRCTGILDTEEAKKWLERKLTQAGSKPQMLAVDSRGVATVEKGGRHHATLALHQAIGLVTVEDADKFRQALLAGIGGGKFAGCGMIDIW